MKAHQFIKTTASTALISVSISACDEQAVSDYLQEAGDKARATGLNSDAGNLPVEALADTAKDIVEKSDCGITEEQEKMLAEINQARAEARSCGGDFYDAAPPVTWNCKLELAAWSHTGDMVQNNFFSHTGSDGLNAGNRVDASGYNWRVYGENLAAGYMTEEKTVAGLLASPGHCRNLMNSNFQEVGTARIYADGNDYISYWTHVFGSSF